MRLLVGMSLLSFCSSFVAAHPVKKPYCGEWEGVQGWIMFRHDGEQQFKSDPYCAEKKVVCHLIGTRSQGWYARAELPVDFRGQPVACDCAFGQELLALEHRDYFCKDGWVFEPRFELIQFANCSAEESSS